MKKSPSLSKGCELNINVTIYKHTALKLNKPTLIISEKDNLKEIVYYISFSSCKDKTNMNSIEKITYYDESGCDFLSELYCLGDREFLFRTRFKQIQEGVIYLEGIIHTEQKHLVNNEFSHKFIFTSKMFFFSYGDIFRFSRVSRKGEAK